MLRILLLEDDANDAVLIKQELRRAKLKGEFRVAENKASFIRFLQVFMPHLVLSDYRLPGFSGLAALQISLDLNPNMQFIFVTGAIGEEVAAETVLAGASGFVLKSNLTLLPQVVKKCLAESRTIEVTEKINRVSYLSERLNRQVEANKRVLARVQEYLDNSPQSRTPGTRTDSQFCH